MRIHQGGIINEYRLADIDSLTFHEDTTSLLGTVVVLAGVFSMGDGAAYCGTDQHGGDWALNGGDPYGAAGYRLPTDAKREYAAQWDHRKLSGPGARPAELGEMCRLIAAWNDKISLFSILVGRQGPY